MVGKYRGLVFSMKSDQLYVRVERARVRTLPPIRKFCSTESVAVLVQLFSSPSTRRIIARVRAVRRPISFLIASTRWARSRWENGAARKAVISALLSHFGSKWIIPHCSANVDECCRSIYNFRILKCMWWFVCLRKEIHGLARER